MAEGTRISGWLVGDEHHAIVRYGLPRVPDAGEWGLVGRKKQGWMGGCWVDRVGARQGSEVKCDGGGE
jgi:hypothetical protein